MNLLVHMDARGTSSVYPHLRQLILRDGLGCAARLIWTTALGLAAALGSASANSGSAAGTPGCRLDRFRNSASVKVKVKGKQHVLHSCVRHGLASS